MLNKIRPVQPLINPTVIPKRLLHCITHWPAIDQRNSAEKPRWTHAESIARNTKLVSRLHTICDSSNVKCELPNQTGREQHSKEKEREEKTCCVLICTLCDVARLSQLFFPTFFYFHCSPATKTKFNRKQFDE